ncbi:MAG: hypothetical protein WBF08_05245 [Candidatus Bathyarchaeia archaeon]
MRYVRLYRMTVASAWYDQKEKNKKEYELHFKIARHGKIRTVRKRLKQRGVKYFQSRVYREFKKWIPRRKVKARFEREEPALKSQPRITVVVRGMEYKGKRWNAFSLPDRILNYAKRRRRWPR